MVERVAGRMRKSGVDPELLERLQWQEGDFWNFVKRYEKLAKVRRGQPQRADVDPQRFDPNKGRPGQHKRSIEIVKGGGLAEQVKSLAGKSKAGEHKDDVRDLFEARKRSVSVEYRDLVDAYYRSLVGDQ